MASVLSFTRSGRALTAIPPTSLQALADLAEGLTADEAWRAMVPAHPAERSAVRMLATREHEAWLVVWPAGSSVSPHDHGDAHGVLRVLSGELVDIRWSAGARRRRHLPAGEAVSLPVGLVHDVAAAGSTPSASLHLYSPPLRQMGFYDDAGAQRTHVSTVDSQPAVLTTSYLVPGSKLNV